MLSESLKGVVAQILCKKIGGGRVAVREILITIPAIANLIREGKTFQIMSMMQTNKKIGMVTLNEGLLEVVDKKLVEPQEAWMKAVDKPALEQMMKAKGHNMDFLKNMQA
jgi:twitching motility protein PilT